MVAVLQQRRCLRDSLSFDHLPDLLQGEGQQVFEERNRRGGLHDPEVQKRCQGGAGIADFAESVAGAGDGQ